MTARLALAIVVALLVSLIGLYVMYRYDQWQWQKCENPECRGEDFDETEAARICRKCGRPW